MRKTIKLVTSRRRGSVVEGKELLVVNSTKEADIVQRFLASKGIARDPDYERGYIYVNTEAILAGASRWEESPIYEEFSGLYPELVV